MEDIFGLGRVGLRKSSYKFLDATEGTPHLAMLLAQLILGCLMQVDESGSHLPTFDRGCVCVILPFA